MEKFIKWFNTFMVIICFFATAAIIIASIAIVRQEAARDNDAEQYTVSTNSDE